MPGTCLALICLLGAGQGMPIYGQGHLVPIGNMAMQPPYGYMAAAPQPGQGMEGTPMPMLHISHARPTMPMYADYHSAGSYQGPQVISASINFINAGASDRDCHQEYLKVVVCL